MQTVFSSAANKLRILRTFSSVGPSKIEVKHNAPKRLFDLCFSLLILTATAPLLVVLMLLVRFTSPGPIFYKSTRLGRGGKIIDCWKFRSMYRDAEERLHELLANNPFLQKEWDLFQKLKNDPRITPIGKFLRKTSLDEFPQFWNVVKGDMSVVGPRPLTLMGPSNLFLQEVRKLYGKEADLILSVRPGITGTWQTSGRSQISLEERGRMEAEYAQTRTFWKDLVIIAKTVPAVLFSRGAF